MKSFHAIKFKVDSTVYGAIRDAVPFPGVSEIARMAISAPLFLEPLNHSIVFDKPIILGTIHA